MREWELLRSVVWFHNPYSVERSERCPVVSGAAEARCSLQITVEFIGQSLLVSQNKLNAMLVGECTYLGNLHVLRTVHPFKVAVRNNSRCKATDASKPK